MVLANDQYTVTITVESMPSLEDYTMIYRPDDFDLSDYYSARLLKIEHNGRQPRFLALVDLVTSCAEHCAVLESDILTMIQFDRILRINLREGVVCQCVDCDNIGGLEQIHPIENGYIIKGECDVFRYDSALTRVWHFCGRDILASPTGDVCFLLENGNIHCRDWLGWKYVLNFDGRLISEVQEKSPGS